MKKILLNCDMGESFGSWNRGFDELIMPHISLANLACGFHAADPFTIDKSVALAKKHNVKIGAHPSYHDIQGFGRRSIPHTYDEIHNIILYQLGALHSFCLKHKSEISYVKPHGALYNDMMGDFEIFKAVLDSVKTFNSDLDLMILSSSKNEEYRELAEKEGVTLIFEAFADRNYNSDGSLVPREEKSAVIKDKEEVKTRVKILQESGYITAIDGGKLHLEVDTICVHSDTEGALEFILGLKEILDS